VDEEYAATQKVMTYLGLIQYAQAKNVMTYLGLIK